jgi:hypothetical protein
MVRIRIRITRNQGGLGQSRIQTSGEKNHDKISDKLKRNCRAPAPVLWRSGDGEVLIVEVRLGVLELVLLLLLLVLRIRSTPTVLQAAPLHLQQNVHKSKHGLQWDRFPEGVVLKVLLHNVAAHNVNVTGRVCYLT